jgi:CMP-N-acetylneuraminic acid synthetase/spore coat polysaccharide biosynthesis predicted glycosyltransferase SpsG
VRAATPNVSDRANSRVLAIIPARGGSKGIPRKNVCPIAGKPLLAWVIEAAKQSGAVADIVVSTDDAEIARVAERFGARALVRSAGLAGDSVTLDPVVADAVMQLEAEGKSYDLVLTMQPTSPLLRPQTVARIVARFDAAVDTVLTVVDDTHLCWKVGDAGPEPAYGARVNRQQLPRRFRETGGVLATRRDLVTPQSRIGKRVEIEVLDTIEGIDIDDRNDWLIAEAALKRKRIAFFTIGSRKVGLGHVSRVKTLLSGLNAHVVKIFCEAQHALAIEQLKGAFYDVEVVAKEQRLQALREFGAHIVVHDELDTDPEQIKAEMAAGLKVVVFEDNGPGQDLATMAFNELYSAEHTNPGKMRWYGPNVYCLRDEFRHAQRRACNDEVQRVLVTFGGTDPAGLTFKVLEALGGVLKVPLTIVAGKGLQELDKLDRTADQLRKQGADVEVLRDVVLMSDVMARADLAFSSAGRTLYELAHMGLPAIVMAQNEIEMHHTFASIENGFLFLGKGTEVTHQAIVEAFTSLTGSKALRAALRDRMLSHDLEKGRDFVVSKLLEG